jgi:hypothetical protein
LKIGAHVMQGGRRNTGFKTTPMSGMQSTRLSSTQQPTAGPFRPNEWGKPSPPSAGRIAQPQPVVHRPVAATPNVPRSGSRPIANVDGAGLVTIGTQTGTPVQTIAPPKVVQSSE